MNAVLPAAPSESLTLKERAVEKIDSLLDKMKFTMQGVKERDNWQRCFPNPLPPTHKLCYEWDADNMVLSVWCEPIDAKAAAAKKAAQEEEAPPTTRPEWAKMEQADWDTLCAESGYKPPKNTNRLQQMGGLAAHNKKKAAAR